MCEVLHFNHSRARDPAICRFQLQALDIGAGGTHGRRNIGIQPAAIVPLHGQTHDEALAGHLVPINVKASFRLVRQQQQVGTITAMNTDAASSRDVPHHPVPGHRLTTLGITHQQSIRALNPDPLPGSPHAIHDAFERTLLLGWFCRFEIRMQGFQHLHHMHITSTNRGNQVRDILELEELGNRSQAMIVNFGKPATA